MIKAYGNTKTDTGAKLVERLDFCLSIQFQFRLDASLIETDGIYPQTHDVDGSSHVTMTAVAREANPSRSEFRSMSISFQQIPFSLILSHS